MSIKELENIKRRHEVKMKSLSMTYISRTSSVNFEQEAVNAVGNNLKALMLKLEQQYLVIERLY